MKRVVLLLIVSFSIIRCPAQYVSLNNNEIKRLKDLIESNREVNKLYMNFEKTAKLAINEPPNPIEIISTEGRLKGDPIKTATASSLRDLPRIYALAISYRITNKKKFLDGAVAYLLAWAKANKPSADPIDDTNLDPAVEAYDLIKDELSAADKTAIEQWLSNTADAEINSKKMVPARATSTNNWNSHRLKVVGEIAFAINNETYKNWAIEGIKTQVDKNLNPDGSSIDFKLRDALHYHVYDLEPLLKLSIILQRATGVNYFTYVSDTKSSIKQSVDWLSPYLTGEKEHGEYVNTTVKFDIARAKNNEPSHEIGAKFEPEKGLNVLLLASWFQSQYSSMAQSIKKTDAVFYDWQNVLNMISSPFYFEKKRK